MDLQAFKEQIETFRQDIEKRLREAASLDEIQEIHVACFGRQKGFLKKQFRVIGQLPPETRSTAGQWLNELKAWAEDAIKRRRQELLDRELAERLESERIDTSLPGTAYFVGAYHPVMLVRRRIEAIFRGLGYTVADGPEIETEYHNFTALNFPDEHPARDTQDTLYIQGPWLLRTHTSPVQIRLMKAYQPPIRAIIPGRVFRRDEPDASHSPVFHQVEGLVVDHDIKMSDLKGTVALFLRRLFGSDVKMRFRPSFFPFTEPSAEVDMSCLLCDGNGCSACGQTGWLEIMGAGMVHPNVLAEVGIDPKRYTGFAFGLGLERMAMLIYRIPDIRMFYQGDIRFLGQFTSPLG